MVVRKYEDAFKKILRGLAIVFLGFCLECYLGTGKDKGSTTGKCSVFDRYCMKTLESLTGIITRYLKILGNLGIKYLFHYI